MKSAKARLTKDVAPRGAFQTRQKEYPTSIGRDNPRYPILTQPDESRLQRYTHHGLAREYTRNTIPSSPTGSSRRFSISAGTGGGSRLFFACAMTIVPGRSRKTSASCDSSRISGTTDRKLKSSGSLPSGPYSTY